MTSQIIPLLGIASPGYTPEPLRTITVNATREGQQTSAYKEAVLWTSLYDRVALAIFTLKDGTTSTRTFAASVVDGKKAIMLYDFEDNPYSTALTINVNQDIELDMDLRDNTVIPFKGSGLLSGSFPLSLITQGGNLPSHAEIRILYRPKTGDTGDGTVVATTTCNADGSWQVSGLDENLKFDIVARIPGFNDVIISNVQPTGAPLSAHFAGIKDEYEYEEKVSIQVVALGGRPPYVFEAVSLPDGLSMNPEGVITGIILSAGDVFFNVTVTDSENTEITLSADSYVPGDPHWDKVVSLLHFDGDFVDQTGKVWEPTGVPSTTSVNSAFGSGSVEKRGGTGFLLTENSDDFIFPDDFTIEAWILTDVGAVHTMLTQYLNYNNELLPLYLDNASSGRVFWKGSNAITGLPLPVGEWFHYALTRKSGVLRAFVNGVLKGSATRNGTVGLAGGVLLLGDQGGYSGWRGQLDELRITKGVARYTEDFTPPTKPFLNF